MENRAFIDDLMREIVNPGVEQLMNSRFLTEFRAEAHPKQRLQGFAVQHYLSNHVINKGLAFLMVRNANNQPRCTTQFAELFTEETVAPRVDETFRRSHGVE